MHESNFPRTEKNINNEYKFFDKPERRHDIYEFSRGLTTYLHDQKVPNIILIDRSPRPIWIGIDEYWKQNYKEEKRPNIYFVNPDGFDSIKQVMKKENLSHEDMLMEQMIFSMTGESTIVEKAKEFDEKINNQFEQVYHILKNQKDKPLAVFDNCIHSGGTIVPVLSYLNKNGYKDLRVLIGDTYHDHSSVKIHESYGNNTQIIPCGIFGRDLGVDKNDNDITSHYDSDADRESVVLCRKEMRRIIQDEGK